MHSLTVQRAAVFPIPDARLGEKACLAIMVTSGELITFEAVLSFLAEQGLSKYDMPEYGLELEHIPLFSNGKIEKREILSWIDKGSVTPMPLNTEIHQSAGA